MGGEDLRAEHGAGFARAADARADDKIGLIVLDGGNEARQVGEDVGAVAVHIDKNRAGGERGIRACETGGPVAARRLDRRGRRRPSRSEAVASVLPLSTTMHSAIKVPRHLRRRRWPMDSASFNAGMMMETGGGIRALCFRLMRCGVSEVRSAKPDVDIDLCVLRIGGTLIVDLVVGSEMRAYRPVLQGTSPRSVAIPPGLPALPVLVPEEKTA